MTFRPMPLLTILALLGMGVLAALGTWQWNRYQEKLHAEVDVSEHVGAGRLDAVEVDGTDLQFVYSTYDGHPVWRVFKLVEGCVLLTEETCMSPAPMFVNLGLIRGNQPDPTLIDAVPDSASGDVFRYIVPSRRSMLSAEDQPEAGLWYTADPEAMAEAVGASTGNVRLVEPEMIREFALAGGDIIHRDIPNPFYSLANLDDLPPQRHLGYAMTWYGLLLAMIGVYIALHVARGRLRFG